MGMRSAGEPLGKGLLGIYLTALVLLPIAALLAKSDSGGLERLLARGLKPRGGRRDQADADRLGDRRGRSTRVFGTLVAWVLVRDEFPGKAIVNALIDLPFALPTIVAGVVLLALYGKGSPLGIDVAFTRAAVGLALLFVTLPFVVRSVQPVLLELDRSMEEAAASLGAGPRTVLRRIVLPTLVPGDRLGRRAQLRPRDRRVRLAGADHRQPAVQDRGRLGLHLRPDPERKPAGRGGGVGRAAAHRADRAGRPEPAVALEIANMSSSSGESAIDLAPGSAASTDRPPPASKPRAGAATVASGPADGQRCWRSATSRLLLLAPVLMIFYRTFEHGLSPVWSSITAPNAMHAFWLSLEIVAIAVPLNTVFGIGMAILLERGRFCGKGLLGLLIDLPFAISPVVVGLSLVLVYGKTGWFGDWLLDTGHPGDLLRARAW